MNPLKIPTGTAFKYYQYELPNSGGLIVNNPLYTKNALERYRDRMTPEQIEEKDRILNEAKNVIVNLYKEYGDEAPDYVQKYDYKKDNRYHDVKGQLFDWYSNPKTLEILHNRYGLSKEEVLKGVDLALSVPFDEGYNNILHKGVYRQPINYDVLGFIELNDFGKVNEAFHEYNHAIQDALNAYDRTYGNYYDREAEAHSYLMNIRKILNLDPSKRDYTVEEVEKIIEEGNKNKPDKNDKFWHVFDRRNLLQKYIQESGITAPELQYMLNNWANKTNNKIPVNIAKNGGKVKSRDSHITLKNLFAFTPETHPIMFHSNVK